MTRSLRERETNPIQTGSEKLHCEERYVRFHSQSKGYVNFQYQRKEYVEIHSETNSNNPKLSGQRLSVKNEKKHPVYNNTPK
jgi:hypothetical protein